MAEGGAVQATAVLAEGGDVSQTYHGGNINVVAGDQINGSQHDVLVAQHAHRALCIAQGQRQGTAMLAEGERIDQRFMNCSITVVAGDHNVTSISRETANPGNDRNDNNAGRTRERTISEQRRSFNSGIRRDVRTPSEAGQGGWSRNDWIIGKFWKRITGQYVKSFMRKVNIFSWKNIQGRVMADYDDLSEPDKEFYPRMKTGFELFNGDYVPQEGFSAHCQPKKGTYVELYESIRKIQQPQDKPSVIIGQPGSGKTVLMKRMAKKFMIANKLQPDQQLGMWKRLVEIFRRESKSYDVVLFMNIRDIPDCLDRTLFEIIFNPWLIGLNAEEFEYGSQAIFENKLKVIIFFDGLDQATWAPQFENKIGPRQKASTALIFGNILSGQLLSHVPIIVSSREHSVALLSREMRPTFITALVGFSEEDAKSLYCGTMGIGASEDWDTMRKCNPAMHSMCLTPLFLIFYMITKIKNPNDPPDCASGVMVSIIQIFLECENARKLDGDLDVYSLLKNLERMAFLGTKEERVVFDKRDLKRFGLKYDEISDIIIQVPGLSNIGQRILDGMFRFFFSHQTLQEILSALFAVDMDYKSFQHLVDVEFQQPHWSVVRSFACGILSNERVKSRMLYSMLESNDLEEKSQYLMKHLQSQLQANLSPASKLDNFVALKEANAFELLRAVTKHIDFSNSPLSPTLISTLCSVMKYVGVIPRLSLVNCGIDNNLVEVFAEEAKGLGIKIIELDLRENNKCKGVGAWGTIFNHLSISECFMDIQNKVDVNEFIRMVKAADGTVKNFHFSEKWKLHLSIEELQRLERIDIRIHVHELIIDVKPGSQKTVQRKETFRYMPFIVENCFIQDTQPSVEEGYLYGSFNIDLLIKAARSIDYDKVRKVFVYLERDTFVHTDVLRQLCDLKATVRMKLLSLSNNILLKHEWRLLGSAVRKLNIRNVSHDLSIVPDLQSFAEGYGNFKIRRIEFRPGCAGVGLLHMNDQPNLDSQQSDALKVTIDHNLLQCRPQDIGRLIRYTDADEVALFPGRSSTESILQNVNFRVRLFAMGLGGYKIKMLAILDTHNILASLVEYGDKRDYQTLSWKQIYEVEQEQQVIQKLKRHANVFILSKELWRERFGE